MGLLPYVPVLPVRAGELRALRALDPAAAARLRPLFVATTTHLVRADRVRPPPEEVIDAAVDRIASGWGPAPAFVDAHAFGDEPVPPGIHPVTRLLARADGAGLALVPVTRPAGSDHHRQAVQEAAAQDGRGICLRMPAAAFEILRDPGRLRTVLGGLRVAPEEVDLVLDLGERARSARAFPAVAANLAVLPWPDRWRSVVVVGTAYPRPGDLGDGLTEVRRTEWLGYRSLWESRALPRPPAFGDYGVTHPSRFETSPYAHDVTATLRYSTEDSWLIVRGALYSGPAEQGIGAAAVPPLARLLLDHPRVGWSQHCRTEEWVSEVAHVDSGAGPPTRWHRHAIHHHLLVAAGQLDQLQRGRAGPLSVPTGGAAV